MSMTCEELESPATPIVSRRGCELKARYHGILEDKLGNVSVNLVNRYTRGFYGVLVTTRLVCQCLRSVVGNRARCGPEITLGEWQECSALQQRLSVQTGYASGPHNSLRI